MNVKPDILTATQLAERISYRGRDIIIMAAHRVAKAHAADVGYGIELVRETYGTFVVDGTAALDDNRLCGYVRWPIHNKGGVGTKNLTINWALKGDGSGFLVSRPDTLLRVNIPCNRVIKKIKS